MKITFAIKRLPIPFRICRKKIKSSLFNRTYLMLLGKDDHIPPTVLINEY